MSCINLHAGLVAGVSLAATLVPSLAAAHGFAGPRFFPATMATDDPFVAEELSLPTISGFQDADGTRTTETTIDLAKRITRDFGIEFAATHVRVSPQDGPKLEGWDNLGLGLKYQIDVDPMRESILSIGVDFDLGGTGAKRIVERFTTITPAIFFGRGLGDLADRTSWLRGFAVTGSAGVAFPTQTRTADDLGGSNENPDTLKLGFALEYSFVYLQSQVRNIGLTAPFDRLIPLVELALDKPINRGSGPMTGTVNSGLIWAGQYLQLAAEAAIPVNSDSGRGVGWRVQLHFFIDDLFPNTLGRPIFGGQ
jgi:hypothetical protein